MTNRFPYELIDIILDELHVGLTFVGKDGQVLYYNRLASQLLGWNNKDQESISILKCHPHISYEAVLSKLNSQNNGKEWHSILSIKGRKIQNSYSPVHIPEIISGIMIITKDVTEREDMINSIKKAAITDAMTGLYNRGHFNIILEDFIAENRSYGIIIVDINGLKIVNDTCGHDAGDSLIIQASQKLTQSVRDTDFVFRIGGDEFLILVPGNTEIDLERISNRIKAHNSIPTKEVVGLNLSVGYCSSNEFLSANEVIKCAEERMYLDKKRFYAEEGSILKRR